MSFTSLSYFLFLPVTAAVYYRLPRRWKNPALLLFSYGFYLCWTPGHALLLLGSTLCTWGCGLAIGKGRGSRRLWLLAALLVNFGGLFLFKYFNFFTALVCGLFGAQPPRLGLALPVGISFFVFQGAGYVIDVYRGRTEPERSISDYALFIAFFPHIAAGPIDRAGALLPQLKAPRPFSDENLKAGTLRFLWGLTKKLVLADGLAAVVDAAFSDVGNYNGGQLLFAALCFAVQLYCDFSDYSDMALGSARVLGLRLAENFRFPYAARTVREFWQRWHMSLSTWFRDYLYFPLGGSRVPKWRHCLNLLIVFAVSGLWHGAAMTFVVWGALHGLLQAGGVLLRPWTGRLGWQEKPLWRMVSRVRTFALAAGAFVFFRADSLGDAVHVLRSSAGFLLRPYLPALTALGQSRAALAVLGLYLLLLLTVDILSEKRDLSAWFGGRHAARYAAYCFLIASALIFGRYGNAYDAQEFLYFRF